MEIKEFIKSELRGWGKYERVLFPLEIIFIILLSFYIGDNKVALVSAICGISYTILAGKGKISCYFFGLCGTLCYAYLSYKNSLYGNLMLYALYYFPMQILGIFRWRKHLKPESGEIVKTSLKFREQMFYFSFSIGLSLLFSVILRKFGDLTPFVDAFTTVFSIFGLILTIKRCIEQWYIWTVVNGLSIYMWISAYMHGSNCLATILMWVTYFVLGLYFLYVWKKELSVSALGDIEMKESFTA